MKCRRLTRTEINSLLETAPDSETRNLKRILDVVGYNAYDFFDKFCVKQTGIYSERPIYFAALTRSTNGKHEFWTIVNKDIKETFSLCKISKKELKKWHNEFGDLYATMEKEVEKNIKWVYWLGFKKVGETDKDITFCYKG